MKKCSVCKETRPITDFRKNKSKRLGIEASCKFCKRESEKDWRSKNRDHRIETQKLHYVRNREAIRLKRKLNYDPIKSRARMLARKIKVDRCLYCDSPAERHHPDYSQPLYIIPLCKSHHKQVHDKTFILAARF